MSQTNTSTNNGQNWNQNSRRGGRGQGGPSGRGRGDCRNDCKNKMIAKYAFEGKMEDGPISKLLITNTGYRPNQFKKITVTLSVLCADKNFQGLDEVIQTGRNLVERDFMPTYPDTTQWLNTHHLDIQTVHPPANIDATTEVRPPITIVVQKKHDFDKNLQKRLLL